MHYSYEAFKAMESRSQKSIETTVENKTNEKLEIL